MRLTRYQKIMLEHGEYDSRQSFRPTVCDRLFWWSTLRYYIRIAGVIIKANILCHMRLFKTYGWSKMQQCSLRSAEGAGGKVRIEGVRSIIDTPGPFVYAANHMSLLETFTLPLALLLGGPVAIVVKEELIRYPIFGRVLRTAASPIPVTRKSPRQDLLTVMQQGTATLRSGKSVLIFPQATRATVFNPDDFNSIAARLAERAGVPLVPIAIRSDFMGLGRMVKDFGPLNRNLPIRFRIGTPIPPGEAMREAHQKTISFITASLQEWNTPPIKKGDQQNDSGSTVQSSV